MALIRWEPIRELASLQSEVNRLFNTFFDGVGDDPVPQGRRWIPPMDIVETDDHFIVRADLPGMSEQDIKLEVEDNVLTLSGERAAEHEQKGEGFYRVERASGAFRRALTLPDGVDPESLRATFEKGVLEVRIPKPEDRKPRRVAIRVGEAPVAIEGAEATDAHDGDGAGAHDQIEARAAA